MPRTAQPQHRQVPEAATHGVADEQRAPKHSHGSRHAQADRKVRAPVIQGAADHESCDRHPPTPPA